MVNKISLTCPSCGGRLSVTPDIDRFACAHCGNEHIVERGDGIISLQPVVEGLIDVQHGIDRTASELAIKRLQGEIGALKSKRASDEGGWYGSKYGWGCLFIFIAAAPAIFCTGVASIEGGLSPTPSMIIYTIIGFLVPFVVAFFVFNNIRKEKKKAKQEWKRLDILISSKEKELFFHQDTVSKL